MSKVQEFTQLGEVAEITMGQSPDAASYNTNEQGLPFLQGCAEFGKESPSTNVYCFPPLRTSKPNSILISVRAPVGKTNWGEQIYCIGRGLAAIKARPECADTHFLSYAINQNISFLHRRSQGSTFLAIGANDLKIFPIPLISCSKQKKISSILGSLDRAIAHTEALIEKYQQIKAGLMHDLFTRGIGADGKLRPTREEAPELYQESAIGSIPREWEIKCLADACEWYSGGTPNRQNSSWWDGDLPWLSPKDMKSFDLSNTQEKVTRVAALSSSRIMPVNTVFIVIRGMILAHSFPVVYSNREFCFNQDIKAIRGLGKLGNRFLAYWFVAHKDTFLKKTTESTHGTKRFDMKDIYNLHIGIPSDKEQGLFITKLDALSTKLEFENKSLVKLQKQKSGLMHDLLTGKVPVKVNPDEVEHI